MFHSLNEIVSCNKNLIQIESNRMSSLFDNLRKKRNFFFKDCNKSSRLNTKEIQSQFKFSNFIYNTMLNKRDRQL